MKSSIMKSICMTVAITLSVSPAYAEGKGESDGSRASMKLGSAGEAPRQIIDRAIAAHKSLPKVPASLLDKTQCIVIVPGFTTAAIAVGGSHGDGVATCKSDANSWSSPAFVDLDVASIGLQAGAKSSDTIVYLTSNKAEESLKSGSITLGADASVVAGNFERSFDVSGADAVVYQNTSGAFLGASIEAGKITSDNDTNKTFYGKEFQAREILDGKVIIENQYSKKLIDQLG